MKLNLKYNATKVDEIEKAMNGQAIENCLNNMSVNTLCLFIQKGLVDDNGIHGVSRAVALTVLDNYLAENDKEELMMDIMEALCDGGFLSRELDVKNLRTLKEKHLAQVKELMQNSL